MAYPYVKYRPDWIDDDPTKPADAAAFDHIEAGIFDSSAVLIPETILDAKGDMIVASAADTPAKLTVGANDTVHTADSTQATGTIWKKVVNAMVDAAAAIAVSKLAAGTNGQVLQTTGGVPTWGAAPAGEVTGVIKAYGGSSAPSGYLLCDGAAVSRTTFADLFGIIGTTYGAGDGSTTFNVPDMRGRVSVGLGTHADVNARGDSDGMATVANRRPHHRHTTHSHTVSADADGGSPNQYGAGGFSVNMQTLTTTSVDGGSGNANDSLNAPAYLVNNYIIKT